jgi:hypothetical protein
MLERQMQELKDLPGGLAALALQFQQLREETRSEVSAIRKEFKAADDESRVFMRILHEDAIARIEALGESDDSNRQDR